MACPTWPRALRALRARLPYVLYIPKFPRALRALRAHAPYVPYVSTRLSIFYRPENQKMETLYPYVFKGTEFSFGS